MFKWLKSFFKRSVESGTSWISSYMGYTNRFWSASEYISFFIGWQYAAITAIADSVSSLNYRLADKEDNEITHDYLSFITPELIQNIAVFMKMTGSAYVLKVMYNNKILGLSMLLPQYLSAVVDEKGNLCYWNYTSWGWSFRLEPFEVMVFAEFNPYQRYPYITKWYSPLQAIAMTIRWEKEIEDWNYALLTNDAPPGMVLTTEQWLTEEQVQVLKEGWERNHTWARNVWKLAIFPFWIKPNFLQSSPKEMEFIAQQNWDRDKILAIYKVPKAVLGIGEGVNVGNVKAFNQIFASRCIEPLAKKIARVFNDGLFKGIGVFEFVNVLPTDEEAVKEHYLSWGITRNEYRQELGYKPVKWGDEFVDGLVAEVEKERSGERKREWNMDFKAIVNGNIKWTDEWMQRRWEEREKRYEEYEKLLKKCFLKVFEKQEKDVLRYSKWLEKKYGALYYLSLKKWVNEIVQKEWERAMEEVGGEREFVVDEKIVRKMIQELVEKIDSVTEEKLKCSDDVWDVFRELKNERLEKIVRTECVGFWCFAEIEAWKQSGKVKYKQWWTVVDERVCPSCWKLHGKRALLDEEFDEGVGGIPRHPNCRCMITWF